MKTILGIFRALLRPGSAPKSGGDGDFNHPGGIFMISPRVLGLASAMLLFASCTPVVQTTSGGAYLAGYGSRAGNGAADSAVREAAAVEPLLRFPARIGLARIENGGLTVVPPEEADLWLAALADKGTAYGEFIPVSPLIAALASGDPDYSINRVNGVVQQIRIGAARQHLDAVLIYEVSGTVQGDSTALSFLELTVIGGYLLPTRSVERSAVAQSILIDVRNGYPYFTAMGQAAEEGLERAFGTAKTEKRRAVRTAAVADLVGKLPSAFARLASELAALGEKTEQVGK